MICVAPLCIDCGAVDRQARSSEISAGERWLQPARESVLCFIHQLATPGSNGARASPNVLYANRAGDLGARTCKAALSSAPRQERRKSRLLDGSITSKYLQATIGAANQAGCMAAPVRIILQPCALAAMRPLQGRAASILRPLRRSLGKLAALGGAELAWGPGAPLEHPASPNGRSAAGGRRATEGGLRRPLRTCTNGVDDAEPNSRSNTVDPHPCQAPRVAAMLSRTQKWLQLRLRPRTLM